VELNFGNLSTTHPFKVQVEIGAIDIDTQDTRHPTSDGVVMGIDSFGGFDLTFGLTTIPEPGEKPYMAALDKLSAFRAAWRADSIRRVPGQYAVLSNLERERQVYGRPRQVAPKLARVRKGTAEYVAAFTSTDPNFYDTTEKVFLITPVPPAGGGFTAPLSPPFSTVAGAAELSPLVTNVGDLPTWPVVTFHGPGATPSIELLQGATVLWNLRVEGQIKYDEVLTVDTRPWRRSATINGKPANGRLRGTQMEKCQIPVGSYNLRYKVKDKSGTSFVDVKWRDAFASL
jgi:hypothetical protein